MIVITLLTAFCLVSAFITLGLGVYVYTKNPQSLVNRLFFGVMLAGTYWALGEFLIWNSGTSAEFSFWLRASSFWPFAVALMFHFILALTNHPLSRPDKTWLLLCLLYLPATAISLLGLFTDSIFVVSLSDSGGYLYHPAERSLAYFASTFYITLIMIWSIIICFLAWRRAAPGKIRRQYRLITLCVLIVVFFGALSAGVLPALGGTTPNLVFIGIVLFSEIITYTILRYGLFTLTAETVAPDIIRLMPDGLLLVGNDGCLITANDMAATILGVSTADLEGTQMKHYFPARPCASLWQILMTQGHVVDFEMVLDAPLYRTISISGALVRNPEGEPAGFILILRDITERKASEKALAIANEKISLLTQLTRHDISNLITGLDGYLSLLHEKKSGGEDDAYIRSCIDIVEKIGQQLQFTREYQNLGQHQPFWQSLEGMIRRAISDLSHNGIDISAESAGYEIYADPLVVKVFYNILENAVRHGEHVTAIGISTKVVQNRELLIVIEDNGVGIPDQDKEKIFRYGTGKNTGLGLALSRDILAVTGIRLIETGTFKKGSRFEILVPASGWRLSP